jgi:hypothetical protein
MFNWVSDFAMNKTIMNYYEVSFDGCLHNGEKTNPIVKFNWGDHYFARSVTIMKFENF